jgi:hypothetical protein
MNAAHCCWLRSGSLYGNPLKLSQTRKKLDSPYDRAASQWPLLGISLASPAANSELWGHMDRKPTNNLR